MSRIFADNSLAIGNTPLVMINRLGPKGVLYMTEGKGTLDRVTIKGDKATIETVRDGFLVPASVAFVGNTAWVVETKFNYQREPALKGMEPGLYHAYAVPLGK